MSVSEYSKSVNSCIDSRLIKAICGSKYVPYNLQIVDNDKFGYSDMLCVDHAAPEAKFSTFN